MLNIEEAKKELKEKTYDEIQVATAWKWASRAAASFDKVSKIDREDKVATFILGQEYLHEAVEHASLAEDPGLVFDIKREVDVYMQEALANIENRLGIKL
jgi:hypothetical protein